MHELLQTDRADERLPRRLAAIAFLDVVGYSRLMGLDEDATLRAWASLRREVIEPRVRAWRGRVVDCAGDGIFVEFHSALNAFRWAEDVQGATASRAQAHVPLQMRIALHLGDVIDGLDGEVNGDGVNTAARLQAYAEPGGVIVSQAVANEVSGKTDAVFSDLGELRLKNLARPVRAFQVRTAGDASAAKRRAGVPATEPASAAPATPGPWPAMPRWPATRRFLAPIVGLAVALLVVLPMLPPISSQRGASNQGTVPGAAAPSVPSPAPREEALRLLRLGRAVGCPEHPCPREWLAARALFERAIAADPDYAPPYAEAAFTYTNFVATGLSLNEKEDLRAAERLASRAAALAPDRAFAHEARGAVLRQDPDRLEDALSAYLRSLAIEPNQPSVRANIGWVLVLLGRPAEAESYLRAALAVAPDHGRAPAWLTYLGLAELFLDREGHGAANFRRAIAKQPPGAAVADVGLQRGLSLAAALALNGELEEARSLVGDLRRQHPALTAGTLTLWDCRCSRSPGFLAGVDRLRQGLVMAGVAAPQ